ncbi:MAG: glycosyltransferase N-terminal domain-containing protein, partial [Myxococcota bacterium]
MIWIYDALWLLALSLGLPLWLPWALVSARRRRALVKRFLPLPRVEGTPIWIHAASVGEAEAAAPVVRELEARGLPLLLTTTSTRGRDRLRELFPALRVRLAPLDAPGLAAWAVRRVRPAVLALIETEIWPNLIRATRARGGRVVILSARISDRSYPRYRRAAPLVRRVLSQVDRIAARSDEDAARFVALGAVPERVAVLGD